MSHDLQLSQVNAQKLGLFLDNDTVSQRILAVLPQGMELNAFMARAKTALMRAAQNNPLTISVATQNIPSLLQALQLCAELGHYPGTQEFYLVPTLGKNPAINGWESCLGVIQRIYRLSDYDVIECEIVYENDDFRFRAGEIPYHSFDPFASDEERGKKKGVYAYARKPNGEISRVIFMTAKEIAERKSLQSDKVLANPANPWNKWEASMWRKCVIHELGKWIFSQMPVGSVQASTCEPVQSPNLMTSTVQKNLSEDDKEIISEEHNDNSDSDSNNNEQEEDTF